LKILGSGAKPQLFTHRFCGRPKKEIACLPAIVGTIAVPALGHVFVSKGQNGDMTLRDRNDGKELYALAPRGVSGWLTCSSDFRLLASGKGAAREGRPTNPMVKLWSIPDRVRLKEP
jgi:hypothetical protein